MARSDVRHKSGCEIAGCGQEASVVPWSYGVLELSVYVSSCA